MRVVVADAGPIHYLVLVGEIELLPRLFKHVLVPDIVCTELSHPRTPPAVRAYLSARPAWLELAPSPPVTTLPWPTLGDGERAALALAMSVGATLILLDDRAGVAAARAQRVAAIGTLGILDLAARAGLADLRAALTRLRETNFHCPHKVMDDLLALYETESRP